MIPSSADILTAFHLCQESYQPLTGIHGAVRFYLPSGECSGFLLEMNGMLWRTWKGSTTPFDWIQDAKCEPDQFGVHSGVAQVYADALPTMLAALQTFQPMPIRDCGHSLGGGLAELAWADTVDGLPPITFEALRVFTTKRSQSLPSDGIRIVNERDIVPHLPGRHGIWSFGHRSMAMRFDGKCMEAVIAHSLEHSVGPALAGKFLLSEPQVLE